MIEKILSAHTSFVIARPEFAQNVAGWCLGVAQLRVKTVLGCHSLEAAHDSMLQAFQFKASEHRSFDAIEEWLTYHPSKNLLVIFDVREVTSDNIEHWFNTFEVLRRGERRLMCFTSFDQQARDLLFGSNFLSRSTFLGNFL